MNDIPKPPHKRGDMTPAAALRLAVDDEARVGANAYDLARAAAFLAQCAVTLSLVLKQRFDNGEVR